MVGKILHRKGAIQANDWAKHKVGSGGWAVGGKSVEGIMMLKQLGWL